MLFDTIEIKSLKAKNRIVMAPMCQYMAEDGIANNWHFAHYVSRAIGQVGIIILEATAIEPKGRISMNDLGLWNNDQIEGLYKIVKECKKYGAKVGIQLAHAGRKAKVTNENPVAPSPIAFSNDFKSPTELSKNQITEITNKFGQAASRAEDAGFDFIEVHGAHGYLINEFLSPLTNQRFDEYGKNKELFLKKVLKEIGENFPKEKPIFLRVSGEEYHSDGNSPLQLSELLSKVTELYDVLHVSSGGVYDKESYKVYPGYQLEFGSQLKQRLKKPTIAVGKLENAKLAKQVLDENKADMVAIGRGLLSDPFWPLHSANKLSCEIKWPRPYERAKDI